MTEHVGKWTIRPCSKCGSLHKVVSWNWLRAQRMRAGLSLREFARRMEFTPAYISDIEHGRRNATPKILASYEAL